MRAQRHARRQQDQPEQGREPRVAAGARQLGRARRGAGRAGAAGAAGAAGVVLRLRGLGGRRLRRAGVACACGCSSPNGSSYCSSPALCADAAAGTSASMAAATERFGAISAWRERVASAPASVTPPMSVTSPIEAPPRQDPETSKAIGLAAATMAANLVAVVFTVIFTRLLGADGYGSLAALLNLTIILFVPGSALQVAAAREGTLGRLGRGGELAGTLRRWTRHILIVLAVVAVGAAIVREPLAAALNVEQEWAAAAVPVTGVMWLLLCLQRGLLQSARAYKAVGLSVVLEALGRLAVSLAFVGLGAGVTGAYLGTLASLAVAATVVGYVLRRRLGAPTPGARQHPLRAVARDAALPIAVLTVVAALQNVDVIMAKHVLSDSVAGVYAATTVAAKAVVWIAVGLGFWVLPEATRRAATGADPRAVLARGLGVIAVISTCALTVFATVPGAAAADRVRRRVRDRRDRAADARRRLRAAGGGLHRRAVPARPAPPLVRRRARRRRAHRAGPADRRGRPRELRVRRAARAGARRLRRAVRGGHRPHRAGAAPGMTIAVRVLLVAVGALGALSLFQGLGPVRDQKAGLAAVTAKDGRTPQQRVARAYRLLDDAAAHTRSTAPEINLAQLDAFTKQPAKAIPRLRSVVAREPANYEAWLQLARTARTVDPALAARARAQALRLSPPVPRREVSAARQRQRDERERRHLPVPVDPGVHRPQRERRDQPGRGRRVAAARLRRRDHHRGDRHAEQQRARRGRARRPSRGRASARRGRGRRRCARAATRRGSRRSRRP